MTIGNLIRKARKDRGMSLEALGTELGVTKQLVWQWERGDTDPRTHIEGLGKALKVPVEYFYGPGQPSAPLEAKIKRLNPEQHDFIETMVDKFLEKADSASKKA